MSEQDVTQQAEPEAPAVEEVDAEAVEAVVEEQIAFDVNEFPGGARSAIEAVLMVVDDPIQDVALASALELTVDDVREHLAGLEAEYVE